ncbi:uncharacterized protein LOC128233396 [Mya arenaria]|uniref:uncharacterized protein LOC128233396 n=1 Tax=Mya arenaria TaxID=6604 RepID=UPI0022E86DB8|nr:uncharacterized protein LOC128233396 [Mya arenaria]
MAVTSGGSSSGSFMPMPPQAPNAIHHVGVSYNLLKGNPDGEYWSTGGEDPGVDLTRKIFTISSGNQPPEVIMEHHDGCQNSHGFNLFYSPESYQEKLFINVQTSGASDAALKPYAFSVSSGYQAVLQQTSKHHYIFQDATSYCKIGHVRYSMNLASVDKYPVTREFASDVCSLPTTYNHDTYMQFIETWGTHIMTEVTIGKASTNRYMAHLRDIFDFVVFNVSDDLSMGGPQDGFQTSYVIDIDSFKFRHEYKYIVGVFEDQLNIGDMYYNDVIAKTLMTIDSALDAKYWQYLQYYTGQHLCPMDAGSKLITWKTNIARALSEYPTFKNAVQPAKQALSMPATWPLGAYSMPKPTSGCPTSFVEGALTLPQASHSGAVPSGLNMDGTFTQASYTLKYCTKEDPSPSSYDIYWPRGDYCIQQYDNRCPYAFRQGKIMLKLPSASSKTGTLPTGTYGQVSTELQFCCRNDTVYTHKAFMPTDKPFYLFRNQHGCQQINGMTSTEEMVTFYNDVTAVGSDSQTYLSGSYPYVETSGQMGSKGAASYTLHYCYYTQITK